MYPFVFIVRKLKTNMNKCHFLCFACKVINMDYGMKDQNPIDKVRFFCKGRSYKTITINEDQVVLSFPQLASKGIFSTACRGSRSCRSCGEVVESMSLQVFSVCCAAAIRSDDSLCV